MSPFRLKLDLCPCLDHYTHELPFNLPEKPHANREGDTSPTLVPAAALIGTLTEGEELTLTFIFGKHIQPCIFHSERLSVHTFVQVSPRLRTIIHELEGYSR